MAENTIHFICLCVFVCAVCVISIQKFEPNEQIDGRVWLLHFCFLHCTCHLFPIFIIINFNCIVMLTSRLVQRMPFCIQMKI